MSASKNPESGRGRPRRVAAADDVVVAAAVVVVVAAVVAGELVLLWVENDVVEKDGVDAERAGPALVGGVVVAAAVVVAGPMRELVLGHGWPGMVCWPVMLLDSLRGGLLGGADDGQGMDKCQREEVGL